MAEVALKDGRVILIDDEDLGVAAQFRLNFK